MPYSLKLDSYVRTLVSSLDLLARYEISHWLSPLPEIGILVLIVCHFKVDSLVDDDVEN